MECDLLIIGGGINGVGIAADAAGRGLNVILCEMHDLAAATSSASSKLIHGGLRYLENGDFSLVKEALTERKILLHNAPHIVHPQDFILPYCPWLRPFWMLRCGLYLYDLMARDKNIPKSSSISKNQVTELSLKSLFKSALKYYDCVEEDCRLVISVALLAKQYGANILTRCKVLDAKRTEHGWLATVEYNHQLTLIKAKAIINAAGPWVAQVNEQILGLPNKYQVKLVKGSHILVPKFFKHDHAFILQNADQRVIFAIPYQQNFTMIGTTDVLLNNIEYPTTITQHEKNYLCEVFNTFSTHQISLSDIVYTWAGIRALPDDQRNNISKISREYKIDLNTENPNAIAISIYGGKITTYRSLAEKVCNLLHNYFPHNKPSWTKTTILPGGDLPSTLNDYINTLKTTYPYLPANLLQHYATSYGTRTQQLLTNIQNIQDLGLHFGHLLYQREVDFLVHTEWAQTSSDILWRRGKIGLYLNAAQVATLDSYLINQNNK